jgi:hypothetical protein
MFDRSFQGVGWRAGTKKLVRCAVLVCGFQGDRTSLAQSHDHPGTSLVRPRTDRSGRVARPSDRGTASLAVNEGAIAAAVAEADIVMTSGGSLRREFEPGSFRSDLGLDETPTSPRAASRTRSTLARCNRIARVEDGRRWYLPEAHPSYQRPTSKPWPLAAGDVACCRVRR